ncbi:glycoside hydrolase family 6 protein [Cellulomonas gilvus]|uniref:Glucanase n=1 Tax=Cellulomonas gilvus (strain ATCC 13127 / NRRL B-14078) TaxID=593907 RepID=F8A5Q3_CELGA|nr:glycoside hydrolase family 6 protein [Cellulomonas gilvus]AEI12208.1 1, 4-beta cellobiohydrolase [Cellulomonas gilvus ATCC 13127]
MSRHGPHAGARRRRAVAAAATATLAAIPLAAALSTGAQAATRVDNPYAGAVQYVNPTWSAAVKASAARQSDASLAAKMMTVSQQPTAVWMDRISAITGNADGKGLKFHLDNAVAQQQAAGVPLVFNLVIYDLPGRDCYALASNGELPATDAGLARYQSEYIDPIAALLSDSKYADLRIAATIEPDSLPNLTTNMSQPECQQAAPYYRAGVKYALDKLHAVGNVYNYIDIGHSGWLGWDSNAGPAAKTFAEVARSTQAGFASIDGFVSDVANTTPLEEPFLPDPTKTLGGGNPIRSSSFYEWNFDFDEVDFAAHMHRLLVAEGFPTTLGMLIDTSRNGWGGPNRPTAVSTSTDLNTYVNESRVDRRVHRGAWCNPLGAGIGELPKASPSGYAASHLDAFVWIKPPGESDGASTDIPNDQGKRFDRMCDPTFVSPKLSNQLTGATPNAPLAGQWFEDQFVTLVKNAYPVINGGTTPPPVDTVAPSVPAGLTVGAVTSSSVALSWTASTDNAGGSGVAGYDVYRGTTLIGSPTTTSFTATGLSPDTAYSFTVRAKDVAGNVSAASSAASATTLPGTTPTDTVAPSVPTGLAAGTTTTTSIALSWNASTDNAGGSGVAGYDVYRGTTLIGSPTTTSFTATGLSPDTAYSFTVRAKDVAGNVSASSAAVNARTQTDVIVTPTPTTEPGASCKVTYQASGWNTGLSANVKVTNTGSSAISGWTLKFTFPSGQQISQGWSATWSQSGSAVTATNAPWNGTLAPGASTDIGFNASHSGTNTAPTSFTLNGASCTVA